MMLTSPRHVVLHVTLLAEIFGFETKVINYQLISMQGGNQTKHSVGTVHLTIHLSQQFTVDHF